MTYLIDQISKIIFTVITFIATLLKGQLRLNTKQGDNGMDLLKLLQDLIANVETLKQQLTDAEAALAAAKQTSYDEGFAAGVLSVPQVPPSDKVFSQAEVDQMIIDATTPIQAQVDQLIVEVESIKASIPAEKEAAVKEFKAALLAKYEEQQASESASEASFKDILSV